MEFKLRNINTTPKTFGFTLVGKFPFYPCLLLHPCSSIHLLSSSYTYLDDQFFFLIQLNENWLNVFDFVLCWRILSSLSRLNVVFILLGDLEEPSIPMIIETKEPLVRTKNTKKDYELLNNCVIGGVSSQGH